MPCRILIAIVIVLAGLASGPAMALDAGKLGVKSPIPPVSRTPASVAPRASGDQAARNLDAIAVVIGNRTYAQGLPEVRFAENDANAVLRLVRDVLGYREGNIIDLRNASQAEMLSVFGNSEDHRGKLWSWIKPGVSDVFVYYSGHGVPGLRDKRGYLLPVDADPATPEINGYSLDLLIANLEKLQARSTLVMLDACFSGNTAAGWLIRSASPVYIRTEAPTRPSGMAIVTAAQGDQVASWDEERRLGLFTRHMLDGLLGGRADQGRGGNGDGVITLGELEAYLDDEMTYAARRLYRRVQQASVLGDPKTVLVADVGPAVPRQTVATAPPPPPPPSPPPTEGKYGTPGPSIDDAEAFVRTHLADVRKALFDFYRREGSVWDQKGNPPQVEFAERMSAINQRRVLRVSDTTFDIWLRYRWTGGGVSDVAEAKMRISVGPDTLTVEKMWR